MKTETKTMPRVDITLTDPRKQGAGVVLYDLKTLTREEWLQAGINGLSEMFAEIGETIPDVYVSVGYPKGSRGKGKTVGQCHPSALSGDEKAHVFIHPCLTDSFEVLAVLAHELIHALDNCESGHKGRFAKVATAFGLEGKMTATVAGAELTERLNALIQELGEYPHALLKESDKGKQSTRMIKCECFSCGYIARTSSKWIEQAGAPICPCGWGQMKADGYELTEDEARKENDEEDEN